MREQAVVPTGVERTFGADEIIVSKTDPQGRLTYVNQLFVKISGYAEGELLGHPHNIIRHPDMPRSVFAFMWERIAAGHEIFAYVVNLAADGAHYWVLAHITPTFGPGGRIVGYHSNRRTASAAAVATIRGLYADLVAEEQRHRRTPEAVAAGRRLLEERLAETGMSYDEFVWSISTETAETPEITENAA